MDCENLETCVQARYTHTVRHGRGECLWYVGIAHVRARTSGRLAGGEEIKDLDGRRTAGRGWGSDRRRRRWRARDQGRIACCRDQSWIHRRQIAVVQGGDRYTVSGVRASYPSPVARSPGRNPAPLLRVRDELGFTCAMTLRQRNRRPALDRTVCAHAPYYTPANELNVR